MPVKGYDSVNLPSGLYNKVKELIRNRKDLGYRSITEFVAESVRKRIEEIERLNKKQERKATRVSQVQDKIKFEVVL